MTAYIMQSTEFPDNKLVPRSDRGYCILVDKFKCKYGTKCTRECWSVGKYPSGGYVQKKGRHEATHWHIAHNAKWTNGIQVLEFNL